MRSDASGLNSAGGGWVFGPISCWHRWDSSTPDRESYNSNPRELTEPLLFLAWAAPYLRGLTLAWGSDSEASRYAVLTGVIRDAHALPINTELLRLAGEFKIFLDVAHFLRERNTVCDDISKAGSVADVAKAGCALRPLAPFQWE